jgi:hypothetical protein
MNKLIYYTENFYIVGKSYWKIIEKTFAGYPIIRILNEDRHGKVLTKIDNIVKTKIEYQKKIYTMQWQLGTYWDKSIIFTLTKRFGEGQLKEYTKNDEYCTVFPQNKISVFKN